MQKNFSKVKIPLRIDPVTDEYILSIPESFCNQLDWYEGTEVTVSLDIDGVFIEEESDD
jgi:hypothetical protein